MLVSLLSLALATPIQDANGYANAYINTCGALHDGTNGLWVRDQGYVGTLTEMLADDASAWTLNIRYQAGGQPSEIIVSSDGTCDWQVGTTLGLTSSWGAAATSGPLQFNLVHRMDDGVSGGTVQSPAFLVAALQTALSVQNTSAQPITNLLVELHVDPSPGTDVTTNAVTTSLATAAGTGNFRLGAWACDPSVIVGFVEPGTPFGGALLNTATTADQWLAWQWSVASLAAGAHASVHLPTLFSGASGAAVELTATSILPAESWAQHLANTRGACSELDADDDGRLPFAYGGDDCDDANPTVPGPELYWFDQDSDGYGQGPTLRSCVPPFGYVLASGTRDCNDNDIDVRPGATETAGSGIDANCDGFYICYDDLDGDGYGPDGSTRTAVRPACDGPGIAPLGGDCDDNDSSAWPGAPEVSGEGFDANCDGEILCFADADRDGHGTTTTRPAAPGEDCTGDGVAITSDDCDDTTADRFPGNAEVIGDGIDQDCNGVDATEAEETDEPETDVETDDTDSTEPPDEGCACDTTRPAPGVAALLLLALARRRRR